MHPDRIRWIVRSTARVVAFVILVSLPISHFAIVYREMLYDVSFKARLNASRVAKYVYANSALWEFHGARLAELIEFSAQERQIHRQIIQSAAGREVFAEEQDVAEPTKSHREPVTVNGKVVGWLIIETSLLPLLLEMAAVIALSLLLAFLVYISFDRWPLRLINVRWATFRPSRPAPNRRASSLRCRKPNCASARSNWCRRRNWARSATGA